MGWDGMGWDRRDGGAVSQRYQLLMYTNTLVYNISNDIQAGIYCALSK